MVLGANKCERNMFIVSFRHVPLVNEDSMMSHETCPDNEMIAGAPEGNADLSSHMVQAMLLVVRLFINRTHFE